MSSIKPLNRPGRGAGIHPMKGGGSRRGAGLHPMKSYAAEDDQDPYLLAEAVSKMRDKLQRQGDKVDRVPKRGSKPNGALDAWSWDPEVRLGLAVDEALRPLWLEGGSVWLSQPQLDDKATPPKLSGQASRLIELVAPRNSNLFQYQVQAVIAMAAARDDVMPEIVTQHEEFWPFFAAITHIEADTAPRTMELLAVAHHMATSVTMRLKDTLACPRPIDLSAHAGPCLRTPGHASLPAGHATIAFMFVPLLSALLDPPGAGSWSQGRRWMFRLAHRISHNRVVAGLHFPVDAVAGRLLGEVLADFFLAICGRQANCAGAAKMAIGASVTPANAKKATLPREGEVGDGGWSQDVLDACGLTPPSGSIGVAPSALLQALWSAAEQELLQLNLR